ncbi:MAG: DUF1549 domain-containing protein, partial [Planctomycetota bacterium]
MIGLLIAWYEALRERRWLPFWLAVCLGVFCVTSLTLQVAADEPLGKGEGERSLFPQVNKILTQHCYECHGPDAAQRQSGLRLDQAASALRESDAGARAIVPGNPLGSELIRRVAIEDETLRMPPSEAGRRLNASEQQLLEQWIKAGAKFESHWAFEKPQKVKVPKVQNSKWAREALDDFVMQEMEQQEVVPLKDADRRTLLRRLYFDLLGIPPSYAQVQAFQSDQDSKAWQRQIDRLLDSPLYGQRWGRHWLDVVRYAESSGSRN